ncbi:MAG: hypothetical protein NTY19_17040 [Planctomycetota bacterium]|nr:hypothetical protein [Planctomycetota bacterium]
MAAGLQLIGVQPNSGELLKLEGGDVRNVAPRELTFQFSEGQTIDTNTLAAAIHVTRRGGDEAFQVATATTDFNTAGRVVVQFQSLEAGDLGNQISLWFTKSNRGVAAAPKITVNGKQIIAELNTYASSPTTATALVSAITNDPYAKLLVQASIVSGVRTTDIATPSIIYSPLNLTGANAATRSTNFNLPTSVNLQVTFTAVQPGVAGNGISIEFSKLNRGGAGSPLIQVVNNQRILVQLNSNPGNETTASQLVSAFNANAAARALVVAANPFGNPNQNITTPTINYSPLVLSGANDIAVTPGYLGLGDSAREVIFRFAETLPDGVYEVDISGVGLTALRNTQKQALGDTTPDGIVDDGQDFRMQFTLDLGPQIVGVVPQPVSRTAAGVLTQAENQIEVYFDKALDPTTAAKTDFYQLIFTSDTVTTTDDRVYKPATAAYFAASNRVLLTFAAPLQQLGVGSFRLRIGTDEQPLAPPTALNLTNTEVGDSFQKSYNLGSLTGSQIVSSAISPQVYQLTFPGASDEPGQRQSQISPDVESHLLDAADSVNGISTLSYNFRNIYGVDPAGNQLSNLITADQKQRTREIFDLYGEKLGVKFVETQSQGFTIVTGDMRAINPTVLVAPNGPVAYSSPLFRIAVMDSSKNWNDAFGPSDDTARISWFETAMSQIGTLLGLGYTDELPPGTIMGSEPALTFDNPVEPVYPGDNDIVHGQYLYRPEGQDIDLYKFQLTERGSLSAETLAERQTDSSLLNTVLRLYQEDSNGQRVLIAQNDDYFSNDSFLHLTLDKGTYYVGVSAAGNDSYDPTIAESGMGGLSEGKYDLRLTFRRDVTTSILGYEKPENASRVAPFLDGDGNGVPGGVYNFWFRATSQQLFVDKAVTSGANGTLGTLGRPYDKIKDALLAAQLQPGSVVRIVGNAGPDGNPATPADALPYQIGFDSQLGLPLPDGSTLDVPKNITVMIDPGVVIKLRRARIDVGSSTVAIDQSGGALQVLGTPRMVDSAGNVRRDSNGNVLPGSVYFTALTDETLGGDTTPNGTTTGQPGDWGGLVFRNDVDRAVKGVDGTLLRPEPEQQGIFLNYVNQADLRYGGGTVIVNGTPQAITPIWTAAARPTVTFNTITRSADAAISANPDSFEESNFNAPQYQAAYAIRQTMTLGGTPSGTVTLSYNNVSGTVATTLTYTPGLSPTAAQVRTHLNSIPELQNNVSVVGSNGGPFTVVFGNALANAAVSLLKQTTTGGATAEIVNSTLFTADYARLGPDIHGNRLLQNSINGVFIRVQTPAGSQLQKMTVAGRWAATDAVYVVAENLEIAGSPGGPTQLLTAPEVSLVTLQTQPVGNTEVQQLTFGDDSRGAPLGNFTLTFGTNLSTAPIPYTSIPTDLARLIQTELDNVLGAGSTRVSVVDSATYSVEFTEGLANANFPLLVASDPDLGGTLTVSAVRDGVGNSVQTMVLGGAPGGKVRLSYNSVPGTAVTTLTYTPGLSPTATDVLAHLNSIPQLNNNVSVVGRAGGPFTVVFRNALANATVLPLGQMTTDGATAVISVNPPGTGGSVPAGMTNYKLTYVSAPNPDGTVTESPASVATADITVVVTNPLTGQTQRVQLSNLPVAPLPYVGRRLYRTTKASDGTTAPDYILIANLNATDGTYVDDGTTLGGLLQNSVGQLTARLHGSLVIDPGVVVKLSGAGIQTRFGSQLIAEGQPGAEVVFTSLQDSRYGAGGTFATSAVTGTASAGSWSGLYLGPDSRASLDYAVLAFGGGISKVPGGFAGFNTIEVQQAQARITNSLFEQNANGTGGSSGPNRAGYSSNAAATIFVRGAQPVIVDNTFLTNRGPVINVNANALSASVVSDSGRSTGLLGRLDNYVDNRGPLVRDNQLDGNGINGMQVRGATLTTESVWDDTDIVHVVQNETIYVPDFHTYGGLRLQSAADQSLVVKLTGAKAGFTATGRPLDITDRIGGVVQVVGQPDQPVVLTALADDTVGAGFRPNGMPQVDTDNLALGNTANPGPQSGAWRSIRLEQNSHDRNVDTVVEAETGVPSATDINAMPDHAQYLGALAPDEKSGDDNLRLGFTVQGSIRQPSDVDTFSFTAQAGTQVWLDIDRTTFALDTVLELVAADGTTVLAGSDNSGAEAVDPSLLVRYPDPEVLPHNHVNPLAESPFDVPDRWTINPKDAGLRVVLPGSSGDTNTYFVRVRSSGGLTAGVYQLQVRLRELDEIGGSAIHGADIRYATTGIDLVGLPVHSPLLGEASEPLTNGADTNNSQAAATNLGNLLNTDRGTLGVAGNIATAGDVDWYSFTVQYDSIRAAPSPTAPQFLAMVFDIDYADGYARANTNLWVYDVNGNLVLSSRDSNVSDDRPTGTSAATTDLSRGSVGTLDPYIGTVEVPDKGVNQDVYYVAVSSNARIPTEMQQYLTRLPANPLLRLEPVNSVQRIAEDHVVRFGRPGEPHSGRLLAECHGRRNRDGHQRGNHSRSASFAALPLAADGKHAERHLDPAGQRELAGHRRGNHLAGDAAVHALQWAPADAVHHALDDPDGASESGSRRSDHRVDRVAAGGDPLQLERRHLVR